MNTLQDPAAQRLDGGTPIAILSWLPDETLYSLCSRHHVITGHRLARTTCRYLFGHPQWGSQHDLPCRLDFFVKQTAAMLGNTNSISYEHTLLPFYLHWRTPDEARDVLMALLGEGLGSVKFRLGLLTSRFRAHHPLKACPTCIAEDKDNFQVAYWHLSHQFPGVWVCPKHGCILLESTVKSSGVGRFLWHLPRLQQLRNVLPYALPPECSQPLVQKLADLATIAIAAAQLPPTFHIDSGTLLAAYRQRLDTIHLRSDHQRLKRYEIAQSFLAFTRELRLVPELAALPDTLAKAQAQMDRLLRLPRIGTHPLRQLVLIHWLFGSWEAFWGAYQSALITVSPHAKKAETLIITPHREQSGDERHHTLLELIQNQGYSLSRAAAEVGIDTGTAMAWAAQAGVKVPRRPKRLKPEIRSALIRDLLLGDGKKTVAARYGISTQTVTTTLRTEPGLSKCWHDAQRANARAMARTRWEQTCHDNSGLGIKAIRQLVPAVYAWLYRNDRTWLMSKTADLPRSKGGNHSNVNWVLRDAQLALAIRQAASSFALTAHPPPLTLQHIYQLLPELRAKLSSLKRLPLTQHTLAMLFSTNPLETE